MQPKNVEKIYKDLSSSSCFSTFCDFCNVFQHFKMYNLLDFLSPYKILLPHVFLFFFSQRGRSPIVSTLGLSKLESVPTSTLMFSKKLFHWKEFSFSGVLQMIKQKTRKVPQVTQQVSGGVRTRTHGL